MIIVHHLQNSRSQRILWMLEELGVEYQVKRYERNPETQLAPPELLAIHPLGKSPVIEDGDIRVAESGAIVEYLADTYGAASLLPEKNSDAYRQYIYWLHYAEGSLMSPLLMKLVFDRIKSTKMPFFVKPVAHGIANKVMTSFVSPNIVRHMKFIDAHLEKNAWFAGEQMTGADIQMSFPLEACAARGVIDASHANILAYVKRVQTLPAYQRALKTGGPYGYV